MGFQLNGKTLNFPSAEVIMILTICDLPRYKNKSFLYQKYVIEKLSCEEIAKEIFSARTTVLKYLKHFNIPVRDIGSNNKRKRGVSYGTKYQRRMELVHKKEQENIKKMRELRDKGFSYWKIADVFNSMKIPTKTGKGRWHAKSIQQILSK